MVISRLFRKSAPAPVVEPPRLPAGLRVYARVVPMALQYERNLLATLSSRDRATLDRLVRVLLGRAVELGPAHAD